MKSIYHTQVPIDNFLRNKCKNEVEERIFYDLTLPQRKISSMFFYDENGSKLFEKITKLPEYYLTRTEIPLIKQAAAYLQNELVDVNIIEFGSGDCTKISLLLDAVSTKKRASICYVPFDVSSSAIKNSCNLLSQKYSGLRIHGIVADFMSQLDVIADKPNKLLCFLGSTIGNFSLKRSAQFIQNLASIMKPKDRLLLGFDMVKEKYIIENAYNDSELVTEQFNKNILKVVNSLVNTDFNPHNFRHVAFYNDDHHRIEMHLQAQKDMTIFSPRLQEPIHIKKNETIHTENSYKFTQDQIIQLTENTQLSVEKMFTDEKNWFTLAIFTKS